MALKESRGNFDDSMQIGALGREDILWWLGALPGGSKKISRGPPQLELSKDASLLCWGAVADGGATGGRWTSDEASLHINVLEMKAVLFGLQSFFTKTHNTHLAH